MRPLTLTTQQIEDVIARTHGLDHSNRGALAARIRYLQRLDFPRATDGVRGRRLLYDLVDLLRFALVFRQLEWNQSPVRAMRAILMNWPALEQAMVIGWRIAGPLAGHRADASRLRILIAVAPAALQEATGEEVGDEQGFEAVQVMQPADLTAWLEGAADDGDDVQFLLIDPARMAHGLVSALTELCGYYSFEVDAAFEKLGAQAFGTERSSEWLMEL